MSSIEAPIFKEGKERILPRRLVVKCGTDNLCTQDGEKKLDQKIFDNYARQIAELQYQGVQVVVVSSGAKQAGEEYIKAKEQGIDIDQLTKKDLTGIGQPLLMERWRKAIEKAGGKGVAQLLVTHTNWFNQTERESITSSIFNWLNQGIIPVINENDPVSDKEIRFWNHGISENDRLASLIARWIKADAALFLTDEGGIYTDDPKKNPEAILFEEIPARAKYWDDELAKTFRASIKGVNQGMKEKWIQASYCHEQGMKVVIAGREEKVILKFALGEAIGTKIGKVTRLKGT